MEIKECNLKIVAIVQARHSSSRLPGKVEKALGKHTVIEFIIKRLQKCGAIDEIVLATTTCKSDDNLVEIAKKNKVRTIRGEVDDVLSRYAKAAEKTKADIIIRVTGDCPFVDPELISSMLKIYDDHKFDYYCNCMPATYPDGLDIEIFTTKVLMQANQYAQKRSEREHVTPWIRNEKWTNKGNHANNKDLSGLRWTIDEPEDLIVARNIVNEFSNSIDVSWKEILALQTQKPQLFKANAKYSRNEGAEMCSGQKLWRRAKRVIPGGNMLLSKRPEMYLPNFWPSYFSRAKGCNVWDLEDRKYVDMSIMGIGTNILGYGNQDVDNAVEEVIRKGNMSTLNCPEEVYLAEKMIDMHKWADMVRFARSGGEANAIAVRIARAATGKDIVAICGYHGWHDWYLATNLSNENGLSEHLLPGLEPNGVPKSLMGSVKPFSYNNIEELKNIVSKYDLAAIKMEVQRSEKPNKGYLEEIRKICTEKNIVMIFDECTSGFRETFGGLHLKYGVEPDLAMFGKTLGNGYGITAVIGKRPIMESAQRSFISSTFWTERIGPAAALKTLEVMEKEKSWEKATTQGKKIKKMWQGLANTKSLRIKINGLDALASFSFDSKYALEYKTLIAQEMLKKNYLASTSCYACITHTDDVIEKYIYELESVFRLIGQCEDGLDVYTLLDGPTCHSGFKRLN